MTRHDLAAIARAAEIIERDADLFLAMNRIGGFWSSAWHAAEHAAMFATAKELREIVEREDKCS